MSTPILWSLNLSYTRDAGRAHLLDAVTVTAGPGQITAILGPSGAGKTTFLNCLLLRADAAGISSGTTSLLHQKKLPPEERSNLKIAYVMAKDSMLPYLTVYETLLLGAKLRLPHMSAAERSARIERILQATQLSACKHCVVGGAGKGKSTSRGERKRLAVAVELLGEPHAIVLDEPTSGIDSRMALEIVSVLRSLVVADPTLTIVVTVHQPSDRLLSAFDKVILLSRGTVLFQGKPGDAPSYFLESCNVHCPEQKSLGDFLLEVGSGHVTLDREYDLLDDQNASPSQSDVLRKLRVAYNQSMMAASTLSQIESCGPHQRKPRTSKSPRTGSTESHESEGNSGGSSILPLATFPREPPPWKVQFKTTMTRAWYKRRRQPRAYILMALVSVLQALLFGFLFFKIAADIQNVTTPSLYDWPVWNSTAWRYIEGGLNISDSTRPDPFLKLLERGVNEETGKRIELDVAANWQILAAYFSDFGICLRSLINKDISKSPYRYPKWQYSESQDDVVLENYTSAAVGIAQVLDFTIKRFNDGIAHNLIPLEEVRGDSLKFFVPRLNNLQWLVAPITCCMGFEYPLSIMTGKYTKTCRKRFPEQSRFPQFPISEFSVFLPPTKRLLAEVGKGLRMLSVDEVLRDGSSDIRGVARLQQPRKARVKGVASILHDVYHNVISDTPGLNDVLFGVADFQHRIIHDCGGELCDSLREGVQQLQTYGMDSITSLMILVNMSGVIFFLIANLGFLTYDVLYTGNNEKIQFNRERFENLMSASAHSIACMLVDIPFHLALAAIWSVLFLFLVGVAPGSISGAISFTCILALFSLSAYSVAYAIAAISPSVGFAAVASAFITACMLVVTGLFVRDAQLPDWIVWMRHLSIYRHAYYAIAGNLFPMDEAFGTIPNAMSLGILGVVQPSIWINVLRLAALCILYRGVAILGLRYMNKSYGLES